MTIVNILPFIYLVQSLYLFNLIVSLYFNKFFNTNSFESRVFVNIKRYRPIIIHHEPQGEPSLGTRKLVFFPFCSDHARIKLKTSNFVISLDLGMQSLTSIHK